MYRPKFFALKAYKYISATYKLLRKKDTWFAFAVATVTVNPTGAPRRYPETSTSTVLYAFVMDWTYKRKFQNNNQRDYSLNN